jgi:hypothetical protein
MQANLLTRASPVVRQPVPQHVKRHVRHIDDKLIKEVQFEAYKAIEESVYSCSGTLFGGYVRDCIVSEYYTKIFERTHGKESKKFYDINYDKDTAPRIIVSKDMDIAFNTKGKADLFIQEVKGIPEFNRVVVMNGNKGKYYYSSKIHCMRTILIVMNVGAIPFVKPGIQVEIRLDVVVKKREFKVEAPFGNIDMLCNAFIKTPDGIRMSNNTGTKIDNLGHCERLFLATHIINDIRQFKTYLCFGMLDNDMSRRTINEMAMRRILKMQDRPFRFNYLNLPFGTKLYEDDKDNKCEVTFCEKQYTENTTIAFTVYPNGKKASYCFKCMMNTLKAQYETLNSPESSANSDFTYTCPARNIIDFSTCGDAVIEFIERALK